MAFVALKESETPYMTHPALLLQEEEGDQGPWRGGRNHMKKILVG